MKKNKFLNFDDTKVLETLKGREELHFAFGYCNQLLSWRQNKTHRRATPSRNVNCKGTHSMK